MNPDPREVLIDRLRADLVGPATPDEILDDRPVDRYLTGILYPQRTELEAREQDDGAADASGGDVDDQPSNEIANNPNLRKPASMGISFRLEREPGSSQEVTIPMIVRGGRYERCRHIEIFQAKDENGDPVGPKYRPAWHRVPVEARYRVMIDANGRTWTDTDGLPLDGFLVHSVVVPNDNEWVITIALVNQHDLGEEGNRGRQDELALFQSEIEVRRPDGWRFSARPLSAAFNDEDGRIAALIYRDVREYAVGHTCSATWRSEAGGDVDVLVSTWVPLADVPLVSAAGGPQLSQRIQAVAPEGLLASMLANSRTDLARVLSAIPDGYADWIREQRIRIPTLPESLREQATDHLSAAEESERRMRNGIACILDKGEVAAAFRLMNRAMAQQRSWTVPDGAPLAWRPFQLGFILQSLESLADRGSPDRRIMDLLWFPTGGGKTEAYLGLIAFVLFLRRIRARTRDEGAGVAALMRYTLRLLTLQQFERASTLTLACELIRRRAPADGLPDLREAAPVSIGLWVGGSATPNDVAKAIESLNDRYATSSPKQLLACPACRTPLRWEAAPDQSRVVVTCANESCELAQSLDEMPVLTVDEMIYNEPPTLLIGTIDKFAQLVRNGRTRSLFANGDSPPPDLIIQDELHLISGPLGSLAGIYEAAIDRLTEYEGHTAKIIGSTATIRRAADQVRALFDRTVAQFPPPGLDATDSCFAVVPEDAQVRRYVGLSTAGRSAKFTLQATYASLAQAVPALPQGARNGYHTLVGYFNALRELGGALPLVRDDTLASIKLIAQRRLETPRSLENVEELTSRVSQSGIRDVLSSLDLPADSDDAVDVLLATNMISVGVDVSRLGLMVVMGQPKTASEYIQATSRVGRDPRMPGLVISILNSNKARDRSHFETFESWHSAIYRGVEATSVTPFASRARDKALHAALVLMARHLIDGMEEDPVLDAGTADQLRDLSDDLLARVESVDPSEIDAARREVEEIIQLWQDRSPALQQYWNDFKLKGSLLMAAEKAAAKQMAWRSASRAWPTLNAMRNVEPSTQVKLVEGLSDHA